jgi:integrase
VCAYLTERAERGASASTIDLACSAISYQHRSSGFPDPIGHQAVRQVRRGLRAAPWAPHHVARHTRSAGRDPPDRHRRRPRHPKGARDAALILLGFASALRRSELTAMTLADIETRPAGLLLTVRSSKTDPEGRGQVVGVAHGQHALTDPVAAFAAWTAVRGHGPGPLFTSLRHGLVTDEPISGEAVARMLRARARAAGLATGLATERITAHSLRAGHATTAAVAGVSLDRIAAQTRHRRLSPRERYIPPAQALQDTSSRDLGL